MLKCCPILTATLLVVCSGTHARGQNLAQAAAAGAPLVRAAPAVGLTSAGGASGGSSLAIEALGGIAGAALGYGSLMLIGGDSCGEDLACTLQNAGATLLLGTAGAAIGTYAAGRMAQTEPNGWGSLVGTLAGAAAVIGLDRALGDMSDGARVAIFSVTHGTLAAVGSRLAAATR